MKTDIHADIHTDTLDPTASPNCGLAADPLGPLAPPSVGNPYCGSVQGKRPTHSVPLHLPTKNE
jgi:hypothetical protein